MRGFTWGSAPLSRRFGLAAAVLSASAILLILMASLWLIRQQATSADDVLRHREMAFQAELVRKNLSAISSRVSELANSPILATALVDSAGKETYLTPFLQGLRQVNGVPLRVWFTDFEGKEIASNGNATIPAADMAWLRQQLSADTERVVTVDAPQGPRLIGLRLLRYARTSGAEGALLYSIQLADLAPPGGGRLAWRSGASIPGPVKPGALPIDAPAEFANLGLRLDGGHAAADSAPSNLGQHYAVIVLIAVALAGSVFILASRLAVGLTRDLQRLERFSSSLVDDGMSMQRAELLGSREVVSLALSINRMLDRLYRQHSVTLTERKKFFELANTIPQLAWSAEPDGTISWYNDRWYAYTGATPAEMKGDGWKRWHHPEVLPQVLNQWQAAIDAGTAVQMTFPLRGADGQYRRFFTSVAPLRDDTGKIVQWFGTNTDLSELEQAEMQARRSEARLHQGMVAARMAVWDWDLATGQTRFAANLHSVFGESWDRIDRVWDLVHAEDVSGLRTAVQHAVDTDAGFDIVVRAVARGVDAPRWIDMRGEVDGGQDGLPRIIRAVAIDVTERKRTEEALRDTDRRKDEFLAMLAHELRNPLAPIGSAAEILKLGARSEAMVLRAGEIIARQVAHMTNLVNDLLDVSRVTRGLVEITARQLDLRSVVDEAIEQTSPAILAREQHLRSQLPAEPVWIFGDRTRLVQVIANLLNNSAKFSPRGGEIAVTLACVSSSVELHIQDNGIGISPQLLPNVFDLFTQGKRTLDRSEGGLGLGLALVKKLVELHGGEVRAASAGTGQGTVMSITLPAYRPPALAPSDGQKSCSVGAPESR